MTYKAQLVVRTATKEGSELIEQIKERASEEGKTYSEMAVELLTLAMKGGVSAPTKATTTTTEIEAPSSPAEEAQAEEKATQEPAIPPADESGPPVDPKLPPKQIVAAYMKRREKAGELAAARILMDFFAVAGPKAGGQLKNLLLEEFDDLEYDELMEPIKKTKEYRIYTDRVISGTPTLYSTLT